MFNFLNNFFRFFNLSTQSDKKDNRVLVEENNIPEKIKELNPLEPIYGKGAYIYYLNSLYEKKGGIDNCFKFMKDLGLTNVWLRIIGKYGWSQTQTKDQAKLFIEKCHEYEITPGGWGFIYDDHNNPDKFAEYINEYAQELGLKYFIHNMEHEHEDDSLEIEKKHAQIYWDKINEVKNIYHGLSSYWKVESHPLAWEEHMKNCHFIVPQAYHVNKSPIDIILKTIESNKIFNKPQIITLQAFWGEMRIIEAKSALDFDELCKYWNNYVPAIENNIIGVNVWHLGGRNLSAMNDRMEESFKKFNPILKK